MDRTPLVSVGLPTYNRAKTLGRAARSVLAQDWPELELVISDNASTDETAQLCEALRAEDERVVYVRQEANVGPLRNFAESLARSRGELFLWLSDDDWLDPSYVSACARELLDNPDHAIVCGRAKYYRDDDLAFAERPVNLESDSPARRLFGFFRQVTLNGTFYGVMRRDHALAHPLPEGLGGDWLFIARLAYLGKIRTLETTAVHRSLEGSSQSAATLAEVHGVRRPRGGNWQLAVARNAYRELRNGAAYHDLSNVTRSLVAGLAFVLVVVRFSPKTWAAAALERLGLFDRARAALERRRLERG